ncbi:MAG: trehalose 6-phosphate phosphatase [Chloroflexota bacterium]|nr:trehalose 6-phosphate phosphatase [Chloroflexota bacterium]
MNETDREIRAMLASRPRLRLFLDYDGTLAGFSDHPDQVLAVPEVLEVLRELRDHPAIRTAVLSGRRLAHLEKLIPLDGILLAGTYGLEVRDADGQYTYRLEYQQVRPALEALLPIWQRLIADNDIYLEDKGWSLALHARFVEDELAAEVLSKAQAEAERILDRQQFLVLPGHKFLEAAPRLANKRDGVSYLLEIDPPEEESLLYLGDDDKDETAFRVIQARGGAAIRVCTNVINEPIEDWRLPDPQAARAWLRGLPALLGN